VENWAPRPAQNPKGGCKFATLIVKREANKIPEAARKTTKSSKKWN